MMTQKKLPGLHGSIRKKYRKLGTALDNLGKTVRTLGPLDEKTSHLIQLAASAAIRSEGAVHSHVRRAVEAGAEREEIYHALLVLTSTIGFPAVAAAVSWAEDILDKG
jgi:AhpD family alkylhydroperoxidase